MIETEGLSGADTLLRVLAHMGVDRIFASPGSEWSPVWEAFAKAKAQSEGVPLYITSRHEEIAVGMASGYAKSTGKLPAVMIHTTVGALHATMALRGALHEQVPMVVFTGESLGFGEEPGPDAGAQWLGALADIGGPARLVDRCVKWSYGVNAKSLLPSTIQRACQLAVGSPKGPVFVSIPMEYLFDKMTKNASAENVPVPAPMADPAAIEELAAIFANAKNPVIITEEAGPALRSWKNLWSWRSCSALASSKAELPATLTFRAIIRFTVASSLKSSCKRRTLFYFSASSRHGIPRQKS